MKQEKMGGSGYSWTTCKSFAPRSKQITMPASHHSIFYKPDALPDAQCQSTEGKEMPKWSREV